MLGVVNVGGGECRTIIWIALRRKIRFSAVPTELQGLYLFNCWICFPYCKIYISKRPNHLLFLHQFELRRDGKLAFQRSAANSWRKQGIHSHTWLQRTLLAIMRHCKYKNTKVNKYKNTILQQYSHTRLWRTLLAIMAQLHCTANQKYKSTQIQKYKNNK